MKPSVSKIEVGGIPLLIEFDNYKIFKQLRQLFKPFITQKDILYKIRVRFNTGLKKHLNSKDISLSFSNDIYPVRKILVYKGKDDRRGRKEVSMSFKPQLEFSNGVYRVESEEFKGFLDCKKKIGRIDLWSRWIPQAFVSALKNIYIFLIINKGGIVLHASGVVRGNRAYIFAGPSGSGKSTVAAASLRYTVLSEDLIGIKPKGKSFRAFSIPYNGNRKFSCRSNEYFKIAGLFRLIKDKNNYLNALPKPRAFADFFILPYGFENLATSPDYLNRYYRLIEQIPCFELHFLPDSSFWRCIDEYVN